MGKKSWLILLGIILGISFLILIIWYFMVVPSSSEMGIFAEDLSFGEQLLWKKCIKKEHNLKTLDISTDKFIEEFCYISILENPSDGFIRDGYESRLELYHCGKLTDGVVKDYCYFLLKECSLIKDMTGEPLKDGCYLKLAKEKESISICEKIVSVEIKKECYAGDETACENVGGYWGVIGNPPHGTPPNCIFPTSDAGKECTDSEQCESFCEAPEGSNQGEEVIGNCYEYDSGLDRGGCRREVKEGIFYSWTCA